MVLADAGEDEVLYTEDGQYAANVERVSYHQLQNHLSLQTMKNGKLLDVRRLRNSEFLRCSPTGGENVLYQAVYDNGLTVLVLVSIRGDQEVNEVKLHNELTNLANQYSAKTILALTVPDAEAQQKWAAIPLP